MLELGRPERFERPTLRFAAAHESDRLRSLSLDFASFTRKSLIWWGKYSVISFRRARSVAWATDWSTVQYGDRRKALRVRVGSATQISAAEARAKARKTLAGISDSKITSAADKRAVDRGEDPVEACKDGVTLWEAWERFRIALERKNRSPRTIVGHEAHLGRYFADWKRSSLKALANDPDMIARRHDRRIAEFVYRNVCESQRLSRHNVIPDFHDTPTSCQYPAIISCGVMSSSSSTGLSK